MVAQDLYLVFRLRAISNRTPAVRHTKHLDRRQTINVHANYTWAIFIRQQLRKLCLILHRRDLT